MTDQELWQMLATVMNPPPGNYEVLIQGVLRQAIDHYEDEKPFDEWPEDLRRKVLAIQELVT